MTGEQAFTHIANTLDDPRTDARLLLMITLMAEPEAKGEISPWEPFVDIDSVFCDFYRADVQLAIVISDDTTKPDYRPDSIAMFCTFTPREVFEYTREVVEQVDLIAATFQRMAS